MPDSLAGIGESPSQDWRMILRASNPRKIIMHEGIAECLQTSYAAMPLAERYPAIPAAYETMLTMGDGILTPPYPDAPFGGNAPLDSPNRGADRIRAWCRPPGAVRYTPLHEFLRQPNRRGGNIIIDNHRTFPWMSDAAYLARNELAYIGATASPNVIKINGVYYFFFVGVVSDPYITTAEHGTVRNQYMPIDHNPIEPWAHGAMFVAACSDFVNPVLVPMHRDNANRALQYAALYYEPSPHEIGIIDKGEEIPPQSGQFRYTGKNVSMSDYKGIGGFTMFREGDYLIFSVGMWTSYGSKQLLVRLKLGGPDLRDFEVFGGWQDARWIKVEDGRLPEWVNKDRFRGPVNAHGVHQIAPAPLALKRAFNRSGAENAPQYIFTASNNNGRTIEVDYGSDLFTWVGTIRIESAVPRFLDGSGQEMQCMYPVIQETAGGLRLIGATTDAGVISGDLSRCGTDLCGKPFHGPQIFEMDLEVIV